MMSAHQSGAQKASGKSVSSASRPDVGFIGCDPFSLISVI